MTDTCFGCQEDLPLSAASVRLDNVTGRYAHLACWSNAGRKTLPGGYPTLGTSEA